MDRWIDEHTDGQMNRQTERGRGRERAERLQRGYRAGPGRLRCRLYTGTILLHPMAVCSYLNMQAETRVRLDLYTAA